MGFVYLAGAIITEVFGSTMMKLTATVKSKEPLIGFILSYLISFYLLSLTLNYIPLSFAYATWSGLGTALTAVVGFLIFKEKVSIQAVIGILLLIAGIILMRF